MKHCFSMSVIRLPLKIPGFNEFLGLWFTLCKEKRGRNSFSPAIRITRLHNSRLLFLTQCLLSAFRITLLCLFVAASHQTRLDTWSKARRPIKVGIKGRKRSGTSRDSNPAGLCCSSAHLVQCEPDEASSFTNPNVSPGTYAGLWLELDTKV